MFQNKAMKKQATRMGDAADRLTEAIDKFHARCNNGCGGDRTMKCPWCNGVATSTGPGEPYICPCGWRSDRPNGEGI